MDLENTSAKRDAEKSADERRKAESIFIKRMPLFF